MFQSLQIHSLLQLAFLFILVIPVLCIFFIFLTIQKDQFKITEIEEERNAQMKKGTKRGQKKQK